MILANFRAAFRYLLAYRVSHVTCATFATISLAADFSCFAGRYPYLLADCFRWALDTFDSASSRLVNALPASFVVFPTPRLADELSHFRTGNTDALCFPMAALDLDRLRVVLRYQDSVGFLLHSLLANGVVYRVVDGTLSRFVFGYTD